MSDQSTEEDSIARTLSKFVDDGTLAGAATPVWREGEGAQATTVGWRDVEAELPIERNSIFRIASMTKPITSIAGLMLCEEGRIGLDEPIEKWAPEFSGMRVLRSPDGPLGETVPAARSITFDDLLSHRSGLTYGDFHTGPIAGAYAAALGGDIDSDVPPDDWIANLAALPLIDQPGAAFHYGRSTDLLGLLIERIEDAPLGEVLQRRIFEPLGMKDTGFAVPPSERHRRVGPYGFDEQGRLAGLQAPPGGAALPERPEDSRYASGGQGLWSTVDDYLAFARIFVGAGAVEGVRLLSSESVASMASNQLTPSQRAESTMFGIPMFAAGHGFGFGVAVVVEPELAGSTPCGGSRGAVGWPGAYGGWWRADPVEKSVMIFLTHSMIELEQLAMGIGMGVYDAIEQFQGLAKVGP